jgi:hypothetical protein
MMNGPADFAIRVVCGLREKLLEMRRSINSSVAMNPMEQRAMGPYFNPEVATLYMVPDPTKVPPPPHK